MLEQRFGKTRLPNDALESAAPEGFVERNRDGDCGVFGLELHDAMASTLAYGNKSMLFQNPANFRA